MGDMDSLKDPKVSILIVITMSTCQLQLILFTYRYLKLVIVSKCI